MANGSNMKIHSFMPYSCTKCGSSNLHKLEGVKLSGVELDNRMCRDCRLIMFIKVVRR